MLTLPLTMSRAARGCAGMAVAVGLTLGLTLAFAPALAAADDREIESGWNHDFYQAHTLVSDGSVPADHPDDPDLKNSWGVAFNPQGFVWVADNHAGKSTLYDGTGAKQALIVTIPGANTERSGSPTGIIFNPGANNAPTPDFPVKGKNAEGGDVTAGAVFIFASEDGVISGWSPTPWSRARAWPASTTPPASSPCG